MASSDQLDQLLDKYSFPWREGHTYFQPEQQLQQGKNYNWVQAALVLQNIQKRLDLLYSGKHTLIINQEEELYAVKLTMQLNPGTEPVNNKLSFIEPIPAAAL